MEIGRERALPSQGDVRRDRVTRRRTLWTATLLATAGAPVSGAYAQASGEGTIIVTARKRDEDALRVPVVATVLQTEDLERRQVTDLEGVAAMVPGLVLGDAPLEVGTEVSLRG